MTGYAVRSGGIFIQSVVLLDTLDESNGVFRGIWSVTTLFQCFGFIFLQCVFMGLAGALMSLHRIPVPSSSAIQICLLGVSICTAGIDVCCSK